MIKADDPSKEVLGESTESCHMALHGPPVVTADDLCAI